MLQERSSDIAQCALDVIIYAFIGGLFLAGFIGTVAGFFLLN
jgi:ribose/xylose/arabinose/galactoside ABC-type transport system permease subunit